VDEKLIEMAVEGMPPIPDSIDDVIRKSKISNSKRRFFSVFRYYSPRYFCSE
jgi:hypothetical protein